MSSVFQSSENKVAQTDSSSTTKPLAWQASHITNAFNQSKDALAKAQGAPTPDGFVAQFTPDQLAVFNKMMGAAGNNAGSDAITAGAHGVIGGLDGLGGFTPKGGTEYNINAAGQYADNPYVTGMVDASMRDARRNVSENVLPQIGRDAALGGNVNSNRRAISEGIVQRGLNDATADVSSDIRGKLYSQGLDLAQTEATASNDAVLKSLFGQVEGGAAALKAGSDANTGLYDLASRGIAGTQDARQAGLNEQGAAYQFGVDSPFAALNNYYNIVGNKNWGSQTSGTSTTNTTTTSDPSTMDSISKVLGMFGALGGKTGFNFLPSDARIKRNIEQIGETFNGLPVYKYEYLFDGTKTTYIGLMAQDVEKLYPEAVMEVDGVKMVNYDLATRH
jgi:hypothetical protein